MMIRNAAVAGRFYPGTYDLLQAEMEKYVDDSVAKDKVTGLISPHAGYMFSGQVTGATISRVEIPNTVLLMGPNHTGKGSLFSIMTEGCWETPFGKVEIDSTLAQRILHESDLLVEDETAHFSEHSIEVQLPFLQHFRENVTIVPILLARTNSDIYKAIGKAVVDAVDYLGKEVMIIASSDMTHYEPQESARKKDTKAIESILKLDEDELLGRIEQYHISMCGTGPIVCLISAAKKMGATKAELVQYRTSGDTTGDYSSVVGYAGVIIK